MQAWSRVFARALELVLTIGVLAIIGIALIATRVGPSAVAGAEPSAAIAEPSGTADGEPSAIVPEATSGAADEVARTLETAADALEASTRIGGAGIAFDIVQRSSIHARPDGQQLVPDGEPEDQVHQLGTYLERGFLTDRGFWSEVRKGPIDPAEAPDFKVGAVEMSALVADGKTWRNDGAGWYETDQPPGLGLDPKTAALLPTLLRSVTDAKDAVRGPDEGRESRVIEAVAKAAHIPGLIAVDLESATEITKPIELSFDDAGRLIGIVATARNLNLVDFDLIVETTITFSYPDTAPALPEPTPVYVEPTPSVEE